ncbi:MAG: tRNA (adenosine(37)-N6)-threonylcarbamoyltransferase complex ATPase subunit type 1 TsaE [Candidatus Pacebacteria bacterium]|nr:tRNA (adenosine(37)-N6)-threonylcarbamoyltransferase complex ATPase subunit type 1 TsaE [Candidatus Paceibacterota bacterium]
MKLEFKNIKEENLKDIAKKLLSEVEFFFQKENRSCVIFLKGDLGAGKTTFTKYFAKIFGIEEDIISPTFVLRKDYKNLIHIDGYRFEIEEEGHSLELNRELNHTGKIIFIEWPERFVKEVGINPDFTVDFRHLNDKERDISIIKF